MAESKITHVGGETAPRVSAESVYIRHGLYGFAFVFGTNSEAAENQIRVSATVFCSPQHAKAMLSILTNRIEAYETTYGEIATGPLQPPVVN